MEMRFIAISFCIFSISLVTPKNPSDLSPAEICKLPAVPGVPGSMIKCLGYIPRFYFNIKSGECEQFLFGGYGGNRNSFVTKEECEEFCAPRDICSLPKKVGPCEALIPRYYFNKVKGRCERFDFGGCKGNSNNFETEEECESYCFQGDICSLPKKVGPCKARMPRYYFNKVTGRCERFYYGGCKGNANNFETEAECERYCFQEVSLARSSVSYDCDKAPDPGMCDAYMVRYYYDQKDGKCKTFLYKSCRGNKNNFRTEEECYNKCGDAAEICDLDPASGNCDSSLQMYYFNKISRKCETFTYTGCSGNANNFAYLFECERSCPGDLDLGDICSLVPEPGIPGTNRSCLAIIPRFYFNKESGQCEEFTFGGCGGNHNNFQTAEECQSFCKRGPKK